MWACCTMLFPATVPVTIRGVQCLAQRGASTVCLQVLVTYGSRVVTAGPTSDPYGQKYKGIWICLELLKRGLAGNYVNFGVFELYGDPALKVALLFLSIQTPNIM